MILAWPAASSSPKSVRAVRRMWLPRSPKSEKLPRRRLSVCALIALGTPGRHQSKDFSVESRTSIFEDYHGSFQPQEDDDQIQVSQRESSWIIRQPGYWHDLDWLVCVSRRCYLSIKFILIDIAQSITDFQRFKGVSTHDSINQWSLPPHLAR